MARLRRLSPDANARWGQMTAPQMVCHLADSCRLALGQRRASDASGLLQRSLVKWIALYAPMSWPAGVPTRPEMKQGVGGTPPGDFAADLADLVALTEALIAQAPVPGIRHPFFGRLSGREWLRWGYLHADHHLRQFGA